MSDNYLSEKRSDDEQISWQRHKRMPTICSASDSEWKIYMSSYNKQWKEY